MTWTKLGDEFGDAARDLSDAAYRTHVDALLWSNRRLLDLAVPKRDLRRFAETADPDAAVAELVGAGWWEDRGEHWYIGVYFAEWQEERSVVKDRRAKATLRQRRCRMHKAGDHSLCLDGCAVTRDTTRDVTRAPGRDGTGRDGPRREEQRQHGKSLDNGRADDARVVASFWGKAPAEKELPDGRSG